MFRILDLEAKRNQIMQEKKNQDALVDHMLEQ